MLSRARLVDLCLLLFLGIAWGSSFMFVKIGVDTVPPITLTAARVAPGAALLGGLALLQGHRFPRATGTWLLFLLLGFTGSAVPFTLINWAETHIASAHAAILMSTVPFCTVLLAHFYADGDRMTKSKAMGLGLGFAGILLLVGPDALTTGVGPDLIGIVSVIAAAASYAFTNVFAQRLQALPPLVAGACTLAGASIWTVPGSLLVERPWTLAPTAEALLAVAFLTVISTAAGIIVFFRLLARTRPSFVSLNNYMVPVIGVLLGALLLGEPVGLHALAALALILAGIAAVSSERPAAPVSVSPRVRA